jgi:hypothetical protein
MRIIPSPSRPDRHPIVACRLAPFARFLAHGITRHSTLSYRWRLIIRVGALCAVTYGGYFFFIFYQRLMEGMRMLIKF